jgi:very-short-patch-repair endonuclease
VLEERVLVDLIPDSRAEVLLVEILLAHGLPEPAFHHLVEVEGKVVAELDVAYPAQRVAIEVDGYGVHLRSQNIFENDRRRQNELEILGWAVLRFTRRALRDRPDHVADQVRRLLRARTG